MGNYREVVKDEDTVFFLGDLTMRGPKQIDGIRKLVMEMPGHKHFVTGNHDRLRMRSYLRMGFESVHSSLDVTRGGVQYHLVHNPKDSLPGSQYVICGHVHNRWRCQLEPVQAVNIGVDLWGFAPVKFSEVVATFHRLNIGRHGATGSAGGS